MAEGIVKTVYVPLARIERWLAGYADSHGVPHETLVDDRVVLTCPDGAIASLSGGWATTGDLAHEAPRDSLLTAAARHRRFGVILVRRSRHAVAIWDGGPESIRTDRHYVQGTTKAGGWSQQRYARRRANQAQRAFAGAADDTVDLLAPVTDTLERLVLGGDQSGLDVVLGDPRCARLAALPTSRASLVQDPSRDVLIDTVTKWESIRIDLNEAATRLP